MTVKNVYTPTIYPIFLKILMSTATQPVDVVNYETNFDNSETGK